MSQITAIKKAIKKYGKIDLSYTTMGGTEHITFDLHIVNDKMKCFENDGVRVFYNDIKLIHKACHWEDSENGFIEHIIKL